MATTGSSYKYYDPYTGKTVTAGLPTTYEGQGTFKGQAKAGRAQEPFELEASGEKNYQRKVSLYDAESLKYRDDLLRMFGQATDLNVARQGRGIMASVGQAIQRRGLQDSGVAASLVAGARGQLASQASQANLDFTSRLGLLMHQERDSFVRGEFDFLNRIEAMRYGAELQKQVSQFQAQLAADQQRRAGFMGFIGALGQVAASFIPGGGAVSAVASTGGLTQSDQFQYQYGV